MSNNIDTRAPFFPNSKTAQKEAARLKQTKHLGAETPLDRAEELRLKTGNDAKVSIPESIKDFSKIKRIADNTQPVSNDEKIQSLKERIAAGTYEVDYDALAQKMLDSEY